MEQLPISTSNMYKYVALSGVAIVIVTLVFAVSELFDIHDQMLVAEERVAVMDARVAAGKSPDGGESRTELQRTIDQLRLEAAQRRLDILENRSLELREWSTLLFTIGIAVSVFGFTRWYRKIQGPMERIAQQQAEQYVTRADTD